jgi:hypothetical protein
MSSSCVHGEIKAFYLRIDPTFDKMLFFSPMTGVSFGMMFGSRPGVDDWSSEDEGDMDEEDDDEDIDDEDVDDEEEYYDSEEEEDINQSETIWEPAAKNYSHMNLKEQASMERQQAYYEDDKEAQEEEKRRQRNAKKRADKRRKQKEKKQREAAAKAAESTQQKELEEEQRREAEEAAARKQEELRYVHSTHKHACIHNCITYAATVQYRTCIHTVLKLSRVSHLLLVPTSLKVIVLSFIHSYCTH